MSEFTRKVERAVEPWRARVGTTRGRVERTILWRIWERMLENEFVDRSVALASKAFVSFFPLVIVVAAFAPPSIRNSILKTVEARFGVSGSGLATVKDAFASATDIRRATGIVGLVLTVFYATSFTTALQRVYLKAWRRQPAGKAAGYLRGPAWLAGILAFAALLGGVRGVLGGGVGTAVFTVIGLAGSVLLWWATAWLMLNGQVRWRVLAVSGALTGTALTVFAATAPLWMPDLVTKDQHQFGFFGVALAMVSWFSGAGIIIMVGACGGAVAAEDPGFIGKLVRGREGSLLNPGAVAALPPPTRTLGLADALGIEPPEERQSANSSADHPPQPRP